MSTSHHFTRLFDYEASCTDLVLASLRHSRRAVEELGLASLAAPYERAVAIFCHIQAARRLWLHRVAPDRTDFPDGGLFPIWPFEQAEREARALDELWKAYLATAPDVARPIRYTSTERAAYESTLADILTHVVNHSTYHRGQIASLVAATGVKPAVSDFIVIARRAAPVA